MTRLPAAVLALLSLSLLSACAATQLGRGAGAWHRISTEHFTLYTDLPEQKGLQQAQDFERWLAAFQQHGWQVTGKLPLRLNAVVFARDADFRRLAGHDIDGYEVANILFEPWIVMPHARGGRGLEIFRHELTHYIAGLAMHRQPAWFSEGMASYFQSASFDQEGRFAVGGVPEVRASWFAYYGPLPVSEVFAPDADRTTHGFYATSWLIVHYLMSEQGEAFETYQAELGRGKTHDVAWNQAFPGLTPELLDARVRAYRNNNEFAKYVMAVDARPGAASSRALSRADEHALQGILWSSNCANCSTERRDESFRAALQEDPHQPQALSYSLLSTEGARPMTHADVARAEGLARAHPNDWLSWITLGVMALETGELLRVRDEMDPVGRLQRFAPDHPYTHFLAAFQYGLEGKRALAIREADRARKTGSSNPHLLLVQAELLASLSACAELDETVSVMHGLGHGVGESFRAQFAELQRKCQAVPAPEPLATH